MLKCFTYQGYSREDMLKKWKREPKIIEDCDNFTHKILLESDFFTLEEMIINKIAVIPQTENFYTVIVYEGNGRCGNMPVKKTDEIFVPQGTDDCVWTAEDKLRLLICRPPKH